MKYGLTINENKIKFMIIGHEIRPDIKIRINDWEIERVCEFKNLGCIIIEDLTSEVEVKYRIACAKFAFMKMKNLLTKLSLTLGCWQRTLKFYINSILLYDADVATYTDKTIKLFISVQNVVLSADVRYPVDQKNK